MVGEGRKSESWEKDQMWEREWERGEKKERGDSRVGWEKGLRGGRDGW